MNKAEILKDTVETLEKLGYIDTQSEYMQVERVIEVRLEPIFTLMEDLKKQLEESRAHVETLGTTIQAQAEQIDSMAKNLLRRNSDNSYMKHVIANIRHDLFDSYAYSDDNSIVRAITERVMQFQVWQSDREFIEKISPDNLENSKQLDIFTTVNNQKS